MTEIKLLRILSGRFEKAGRPKTTLLITISETPRIKTPGALELAIRKAVTEWPGLSQYTNADDFNIGDLASLEKDESLIACLRNNGVHGLQIHDLSAVWNYDEILHNGIPGGDEDPIADDVDVGQYDVDYHGQ